MNLSGQDRSLRIQTETLRIDETDWQTRVAHKHGSARSSIEQRAQTIAVLNPRSDSGKTTTAVNFSVALAPLKKKGSVGRRRSAGSRLPTSRGPRTRPEPHAL